MLWRGGQGRAGEGEEEKSRRMQGGGGMSASSPPFIADCFATTERWTRTGRSHQATDRPAARPTGALGPPRRPKVVSPPDPRSRDFKRCSCRGLGVMSTRPKPRPPFRGRGLFPAAVARSFFLPGKFFSLHGALTFGGKQSFTSGSNHSCLSVFTIYLCLFHVAQLREKKL